MLKWLGMYVCDSLASTQREFLIDTRYKLRICSAIIVANRGRFSRRELVKLYSSFCDHAILSTSGLYPIFTKIDLKQMRVNYFRYCKFLVLYCIRLTTILDY